MKRLCDMGNISTQLELVRECYQRVASAQTCWNDYRRAAGRGGTATPELPQFVSLMTELTHTAEQLDHMAKERRKRFEAIAVLQATLRFKDGSTRRVAVSKPTDEIDEPFIGEMFYDALTRQGVVASLEDYPVLVVDRRKRVIARIPTESIML